MGMPPPSSTKTMAPLHPSQRRIHQMLSSYVTTIRRDDFLERLNNRLYLRTSASAGSDAPDMKSYYAKRPQLRSYTLGVEMDRDMDYTLVTKDGRTISEKDAIRSYFGAREIDEASDRCGEACAEELLVRAANQSLLADAMTTLTGSEEALQLSMESQSDIEEGMGLVLRGPMLSMTSAVDSCHFTIDLRKQEVEAICVLSTSVPFEEKRLVLATAILVVDFRPLCRYRQLHCTVQYAKSLHLPLSKTIRDAAVSLAKDQKRLLLQSDIEEKDPKSLKESAAMKDSHAMFDFSIFKL